LAGPVCPALSELGVYIEPLREPLESGLKEP